MLLDSLWSLLGFQGPPPAASAQRVETAPSLVPDAALSDDDDPVWSSARIAVAEALWGEGFLFPGGEAEALRLAKPLGLTGASSLLLIGAGTGGPARSITEEFGVWVTGYEACPHLVEVANERSQRAGLGRRAQVELLDLQAPKLPRQYFHHAMALSLLRGGDQKPLLAATAQALKPGGQFVLVEAVADQPLDLADPMAAAWIRLDCRPAKVPTELEITNTLTHLGFDVRIAEDVTSRHTQAVMDGWRSAVQAMTGAHPTLRQAATVVREAELWLARCRLMRAGRLRLVRWHAIGGG